MRRDPQFECKGPLFAGRFSAQNFTKHSDFELTAAGLRVDHPVAGGADGDEEFQGVGDGDGSAVVGCFGDGIEMVEFDDVAFTATGP